MLAQLVCIDRRYQRMNCFNIRELQSMLKRKFFNDLINSQDHRELLNESMINLRYKTNTNTLTDPDIITFYNFGTTFNPKLKSENYISGYTANFFSYSFLSSYQSTNMYIHNLVAGIYSLVSYIETLCVGIFHTLTHLNLFSVFSLISLPINTLALLI